MKRYLLSFIILINSLTTNAQEKGLDQRIDEAFKPISDFFSSVIFFEIAGTPFVILLLVGSAIFFTAYFGFPNIRYFWSILEMNFRVSTLAITSEYLFIIVIAISNWH